MIRSPLIRQLFADYGMIFVLLLLMVAFSILTIKEQRPTGADAGQEVANMVVARFGANANVFIAAPAAADDRLFVQAVQNGLASTGIKVVGAVSGTPGEARKELEARLAAGTTINAIAVTGASATWNIFDRFPQLTKDSFVFPRSGRGSDFLKLTNLVGVANQTAIYAVIAIAMTMVIITGGIDLSVGSLVALSSVTATVIIRDYCGGSSASIPGVVGACLIAITVASLAGFFNGVMITFASLPSFIVTLAMMLMASGLAQRLSNLQSISPSSLPESFQWLGGNSSFGVPNPILIMVLLYAFAHGVMGKTVFGRVLYAIGGNAQAARLSGIRVERARIAVYTISGALAGLGGIILSSRLNAGDPKYGNMYELEVIAAVVVGGTSLMGGEGRMLGTLIGAFIIAVIRNGMNLMSVGSSNQKIVLGAVLLISVMIDTIKRGRLRR